MAKVKISEYSTTNSSNTDINSINIDEGCAPSGINNAIREVMVHLKNWQTNASGDGATFASLVVQGTGSFTGAVTMSAGATLSGTNTLSGATVMAASLGTSASPSIYFTSDTNTGLFSPTADTIAASTGGSERMRIDSSGNVGIGTTAPAGKLDITGSRTTQYSSTTIVEDFLTVRNVNNSSAANQQATIALVASANNANNNGVVQLSAVAPTSGASTADFVVQTRNAGTTAEVMRIDSSGNVGIGETTPASYGKLVVTQTTGSTIYATADVGYAILDAATNSSGSRFNIAGGNSTNGVTLWGYNSTRTGYTPINYGASEHIFKVDTTEKARLNTSGNLALASNLGIGGATPTTSGAGITFPATQSASTDANTLDDYEEGTWTPTVSNDGGSIGSYIEQTGNYTKIGNIVRLSFYLNVNKGTATGNLTITGLPFTAQAERGMGSVDWYVPGGTGIVNCVAWTGTSAGTIVKFGTITAANVDATANDFQWSYVNTTVGLACVIVYRV